MEYVDVLRFIAIAIIVMFGVFAVYDRFSFTYGSPSRRYLYQRRLQGDLRFETRGSSWFLHPAIHKVANLPRFEWDKEPDRRIIHAKTGRVHWNNKLD